MAKFRCCGNFTTAGHADDCSLKPPPREVKQEEVNDEDGCQFDILHFEHIGECKGTCGDQGEAIQTEHIGEDGTKKLVIVLIDLGDDPEEARKELEERGLRVLNEEEMMEVMSAIASGDLEIEVQTMTREELDERFPRRGSMPKTDPNPFLTIKEAAKVLGFSLGWTRTLCRKGRLPGAIKLDRRWAIPHDAIYMKED